MQRQVPDVCVVPECTYQVAHAVTVQQRQGVELPFLAPGLFTLSIARQQAFLLQQGLVHCPDNLRSNMGRYQRLPARHEPDLLLPVFQVATACQEIYTTVHEDQEDTPSWDYEEEKEDEEEDFI